MTTRAGEVDGVRPPDRVTPPAAPGEESPRHPRRDRRPTPSRVPRPEPASPEEDGALPPARGEKGSLVDIQARAAGGERSICTVCETRGGRSCRVQCGSDGPADEFTSDGAPA